MEAPEFVFVALVLGVPIALAIWLIVRAVAARNRIEELSRRLGALESEVFHLRKERETGPAEPVAAPAVAPSTMARVPITSPVPADTLPRPEPARTPVPPPVLKPVITPFSTPPPLPETVAASSAAAPPVAATKAEPWRAPEPAPTSVPSINWEQFLGVKGFAYAGGLAAFLGVALFVKYSFDRNWVTPELRVALGFLTGLGLLIVGAWLHRRKQYTVGAQTLCATGVLILYAVTFACRSIYHFQFFGTIPTFLLMVLITTTAFLLAVRLNALVVAILGMLGGFLTPILLSTGQDNPLGLFGYIAILDAGLIVVALHRRWFFLAALAAAGTVLMQIGWAVKFFVAEKYFEGNKILIAMAVLLGFNALYLAATGWARFRQQANAWFSGSALGLAAVALGFTASFLTFAPLAQRPWLMFGFVFIVDLIVTTLVLLDGSIVPAQPVAGLAVFALLAFWTSQSLNNELLNAALTFYFVFAIVHSAFPVWMRRRRGVTFPLWGSRVFPPLALVLVLIPIFQLAEVSFLVWPFVLLVDVLAIGLAVLTASLLPVLTVMLLTLAATGALIFKIPATLTGLPISFFLLGVFAVFFVAVSAWAVRRLKPGLVGKTVRLDDDALQPENLAALLPACSAALPFLLLIMATLRLPLANPSPVFGLALLLVVLLLGVTKLFSQDWLPAVGLVCVTALESAWHFNRFDPANPTTPLAWYVIFLAVFALFPFLFLRQFGNKVVPWATAALAGPPQFFLMHRLIAAAYPNPVMGLLPAAFALPSLLSLVLVLKRVPAANTARLAQLAWFGGVALFFITLIFPIQFDRQWITIGWALEGAALLWLFHRVPHPGLRLAGTGLLMAAFARLALNPAVLEYHARSTTPIWNWYLYAYGIVTACLFLGARLLAPPRHQVLGVNTPPILAALGTVLAFLLLNIEIADFFSEPGSTLTFQFSGNFARDMTYSIAWALFALVLLGAGITKKLRAPRYAALGLLSVTLIKLFLHDLAHLAQLYRIGAFISVAAIAMLASFAYQRFFSADLKTKESRNETES
jgi:uncharacterized membrane protein